MGVSGQKIIDGLNEAIEYTKSAGTDTQRTLLLNYLKAGNKVTNLVAIGNLGIGSLSSRIAELRKEGHKIKDEIKTDFHGRKYKSYYTKPVASDSDSLSAQPEA